MQQYEIMAIISNSLNETEAKEQVKTSLVSKIEELRGKVTFEDFWGSKGFAYKIDGEKWGYYAVLRFDLDAQQTQVLRRDLTIDTKVVRFLITSVTKHMGVPVSYAEIVQKSQAQKQKEAAPAEEAAEKSAE